MDLTLPTIGGDANTWAPKLNAALTALSNKVDAFGVDVRDFGAVADGNINGGGTNNSPAIQAAINACPVGGEVRIDGKGGDYFCGQTLVIDKPLRLVGGSSTSAANRLIFPVDVTGIRITRNAAGVRPSDWLIEDLHMRAVITTRKAAGDFGYGVHVMDGRGRMNNVMVEEFSNHGVFLEAGAQVQPSARNVTKSVLDRVRVYGAWGDGINCYGTDVQACLFIKPDIVSCAGWGLNFDTANINQVIFPHFDQRFRNSPGIIRDCANSNDYGFLYVEPGGTGAPNAGTILLDKTAERESIYAKFETAGYAGIITIVDNTTSKSAHYFDRIKRATRRGYSTVSLDGQHEFREDAGVSSTSGIASTYVPGTGSTYTQKVYDTYSRGIDTRIFGSRVQFDDRVRLFRVTTATRPAASAGAGTTVYDTDLGKPIYSNGTAWTDAMGTVV